MVEFLADIEALPNCGSIRAVAWTSRAGPALWGLENGRPPCAPCSGGRQHERLATDIILEARAITKRYPGTVALDGVTFRVHRNQVNVLIGENGAGKSTLMRILAGVETADEGELLLDRVPIVVRSPREAAAHGISIVHQELSVLPNFDISENVFAGREPVKNWMFVDRASQDARSSAALRRLRKPMQPTTQAAHLSLGCRQIVEVARTLDQGARILILDEPTSALSSAEADSLFQVIEDLKRSGVTIIYISHRLHEILHLGDWFTVLRSGSVVGEATRAKFRGSGLWSACRGARTCMTFSLARLSRMHRSS